jgi:GMP reductase
MSSVINRKIEKKPVARAACFAGVQSPGKTGLIGIFLCVFLVCFEVAEAGQDDDVGQAREVVVEGFSAAAARGGGGSAAEMAAKGEGRESSFLSGDDETAEAVSGSFDYHQMNLIPRKCIVTSRSLCDTSFVLGAHRFKMPIVPANMECVIDRTFAIKLARAGYFYIYHRFSDTLAFAAEMKSLSLPVSISVGINDEAHTLIDSLAAAGIAPDYVTIDIAHGHAETMREMIQYIKKTFPGCFVIAGNVATAEATRDLEFWGADAIKVGIGPGSACTTYSATGFGSRGAQASIVQSCARARLKPSTVIIADGGIKEPGDIAKSLALGANLVMVGGMFSSLTDSPGNTVEGADGRVYKEFWGSASSFQSGKTHRVEGTKKLVPMKTHGVLDEMRFLEECLQSAISYGGGRDLECFKGVRFFLQGAGW